MGRLFSPEGPVMVALGKVADLLILSTLWFLCSMPIITIGPATSALYYVSLKLVRKEETAIVKPFFHAFKDNLLQGMVQTLIFLVGGICFFLNHQLIYYMNGALRIIFIIIYLVLLVCSAATVIYTFALQAQFNNRVTATIRNAFMLALQYPVVALIVLVVHLVPVAVWLVSPIFFMRGIPLLICLGPGVIAYLCAKFFARIFAPLIEESLALEKEKQAPVCPENEN